MLKSRFIRYGKIVLPIVIIIVIIIQGKKELSGLSLKDALKTISSIPNGGFYWAVLVGLLAVLTMFFYDFLLLRSLRAKATLGKTLRVSWIANSINGVLGFGGLAGASLRALLYKPYVKEHKQLIKAIAWMAPSLGSGLSILAFLAMINVFPVRQVLMDVKWLWVALFGVFAVLPAYIFFSKWKGKEMASAKTTTLYTLVSFIEWTSAGVTAYLILALMGVDITFMEALGAYVIAAVAGTISMVPGGIGTFDLIFLIALQSYGIDKSVVLSALLLFRLVYYFIPFGLGLVVAAFEMPGLVSYSNEEQPNTRGMTWSIQRVVLDRLSDISLTAITLIPSLVIMFAMMTPVYAGDVERLMKYEPSTFMALFSGLTLGFGLILLALTKGIYRRTQQAYWLAQVALFGAAVTSLLRGMNWKISLFIMAAALLLFLLRKQFVRVRTETTTLGTVFFILIATGFMFIYYTVSVLLLMVSLSPEFEVENTVVQSLDMIYFSAIVAILFVPIYLFVGKYLFDQTNKMQLGEPASPERLKRFLEHYGGHVLSHLGYTGDKWFYFSSDGKVLIQFAKKGNRIIVLGDPSGDSASFRDGLEEFLDKADQFGYRVVFYQIDSDLMPLYHDLGYRFFKLGEEAVVDLERYHLDDVEEHEELVQLKEKFEKAGYTFQFVEPPIPDSLMTRLRKVSDAYLEHKTEKRFSLGSFDPSYIKRAPIGTLTNRVKTVEAFITVLPAYCDGHISVDLMRRTPEAPDGALECLLLYMIEWAKQHDYRRFNLGMTPLSNAGQAKRSFMLERIAGAIFSRVNHAYGLSGDRAFKETYDPVWESKYLAYRRNRSLPWSIYHVGRLIEKGGDAIATETVVQQGT